MKTGFEAPDIGDYDCEGSLIILKKNGASMGGRWALGGCQEGVADGWQEGLVDQCQGWAADGRS